MTTVVDAPAALTRGEVRYSPSGTHAVCVAETGEGRKVLECHGFESGRSWLVDPGWPLGPEAQPLPLDDGRVLACRARDGVWELLLIDRDPVVVGTICAPGLVGLRLVPGPGRGPAAVAIGVTGGRSTIWSVEADRSGVVQVTDVEGVLLGGVWLDDAATHLAVTRALPGQPAKAVALGLREGTVTALLNVTAGSNDQVLLCSPRSGLIVVGTDAGGRPRLGWGRLASGSPVRFPSALSPDGLQELAPLALSPDGQQVLLRRTVGARSALEIYSPTTDRLSPLALPDGWAGDAACWTGDVVRILYSTPTSPAEVVEIPVGGPPPAIGNPALAGAHLEQLPGPAGPIEAIVYGGPRWRTSAQLVVALHGGPLDAWRFAFDPLFQQLAAAGVAVVAPNQRGSTGYGADHALAMRGAWGGPDLDDVLAIARSLVRERDLPLMLLGFSYGAYLALLAASCDPWIWARCAAVAPFLSGARLHAQAAAGIRGLIERLGGLTELDDELGPRDVLLRSPEIAAEVLLVHGADDDLIPVSQSRTLARQRAGLRYLAIPGGTHDLLHGPCGPAVAAELVRFLAQPTGRKEVNST